MKAEEIELGMRLVCTNQWGQHLVTRVHAGINQVTGKLFEPVINFTCDPSETLSPRRLCANTIGGPIPLENVVRQA